MLLTPASHDIKSCYGAPQSLEILVLFVAKKAPYNNIITKPNVGLLNGSMLLASRWVIDLNPAIGLCHKSISSHCCVGSHVY